MAARGYASIGLFNPKTPSNVGSVLRAAFCYDAAMVAIEGDRIDRKWVRSGTNTPHADNHIPVLRGTLHELIPFSAVPVAVDLVDSAEELQDFKHPNCAFYVFGPEDGTLGKRILDWCPKRIMVPTRTCMNLAATVNVVLYDRLAKQLRAESVA